MATVLKAKYFPLYSIWEAKLGLNPSFAWKSITSSRFILDMGSRWRIGKRNSIRIWEDAWIAGAGTGKVISPCHENAQNLTVDHLIEPNSRSWDTASIKRFLLPIDGPRILNTPIGSALEDDKLLWNASLDGIFRVRDAYRLALSKEELGASSNGPDPLWHLIWGLGIPPKAKIFVWRAFWDILPHGANLSKKGIEGVGRCPRCGEWEDNIHVLRDCDWARLVWKNIKDLPMSFSAESFKEWVAEIVNNKVHPSLELICMCAWQIWKARNDLWFEKILIHPNMCFFRAKDLLDEYGKTNVKLGHVKARREAKWSRPPEGFVKINIDAAVDIGAGRAAIGMVARDSVGAVLVAAAHPLGPWTGVERAEIEGMLWAVSMVASLGWKHCIFEGDAKLIIDALNGRIGQAVHNQVLIDNILARSQDFAEVSFSFCFREANAIAHRLARWGLSQPNS